MRLPKREWPHPQSWAEVYAVIIGLLMGFLALAFRLAKPCRTGWNRTMSPWILASRACDPTQARNKACRGRGAS